MAIKIPLYLLTFNTKVGSLYKKYLRQLEARNFSRVNYRFEAVLCRQEFDKIMCEKDMRKAKQMLLDKEEEFYKQKNVVEPIFPTAPKGVAYEREPIYPDWVLDFWHPLEKAIYPEYFARREIRKQQYIEMWEKMHGPPKPVE